MMMMRDFFWNFLGSNEPAKSVIQNSNAKILNLKRGESLVEPSPSATIVCVEHVLCKKSWSKQSHKRRLNTSALAVARALLMQMSGLCFHQ